MPDYNENDINARLALLIQNAEETKSFRQDLIVRLERIETQCRLTNGRVNKQEELEVERQEDLKQIIGLKRFVTRYVLNRYFLVLFSVALIGAVKVASNSELRELFLRILGL